MDKTATPGITAILFIGAASFFVTGGYQYLELKLAKYFWPKHTLQAGVLRIDALA